eukprot:1148560-Rhodomonas_salina.1
MRFLVLSWAMLLRFRYAMPGTDLGYAPTRDLPSSAMAARTGPPGWNQTRKPRSIYSLYQRVWETHLIVAGALATRTWRCRGTARGGTKCRGFCPWNGRYRASTKRSCTALWTSRPGPDSKSWLRCG